MEKKIELVKMKARDLKTAFGNPRKINDKKLIELENSLETFGDFGIFLIDENNNVIAGNQRLKAIINKFGDDTDIDCKRLIGYTRSELKAINIKDNTHSGEWDLDMLAEWTAEINLDLGLTLDNDDVADKVVDGMNPIRFEKYDYVIIACNNEIDYNELTRKLGIEGKKVNVTNKRKIKARAVWYQDIKCQLIEKKEENK